MRTQKTTGTIITSIIAALAAIAAIITFLCTKPYIPSKQLSFESYLDKVVILQNKVDSVYLLYKDISIDNIWKISLIAKNTGKNTIVGLAASSDTDNHDIILDFGSDFKVLNFDVRMNDCHCIAKNLDNHIDIGFQKWNAKEEVRLDILVWNPKNTDNEPVVSINERDLVGVKIKQKSANVNQIIEDPNSLDWLLSAKKIIPSWILKTGRVLGLFICILMTILPFLLLVNQLSQKSKYRKWKAEHFDDFCRVINESALDDSSKKKLIKDPTELTPDISRLLNLPSPPNPMPWYAAIFTIVVYFILLTIPFLICGLFLFYNI